MGPPKNNKYALQVQRLITIEGVFVAGLTLVKLHSQKNPHSVLHGIPRVLQHSRALHEESGRLIR